MLNFAPWSGGYSRGELSTVPQSRYFVLVRCRYCKQQACRDKLVVGHRNPRGVPTDTLPKTSIKIFSIIIKFFPEIFQVLCWVGSEKYLNPIIKLYSIAAHFQLYTCRENLSRNGQLCQEAGLNTYLGFLSALG